MASAVSYVRRHAVAALAIVVLIAAAIPAAGFIDSPSTPPRRGVALGMPETGWILGGTAEPTAHGVRLTRATDRDAAGSAFWNRPISLRGLVAQFDGLARGGLGADGMAFVLGDPSLLAHPGLVGADASGHGFDGLPGVAIVIDTHRDVGDPYAGFVAIVTGDGVHPTRTLAAAPVAGLRGTTHNFAVRYADGALTVAVDERNALSVTIALPSQVVVGFTASTGSDSTDDHEISSVSVVSSTDTVPSPAGAVAHWQLVGPAAQVDHGIRFTSAVQPNVASAAFWSRGVSVGDGMRVSFDALLGHGASSGADGMTLVLLDGSTPLTRPAAGVAGGGLGFAGLAGTAVALGTDIVGVSAGGNDTGALAYLAAARVPALRNGRHHLDVDVSAHRIAVSVDGVPVVSASVAVPPVLRLGFTASVGGGGDEHQVTNLSVRGIAPPLPAVLAPADHLDGVYVGLWAPTGRPEQIYTFEHDARNGKRLDLVVEHTDMRTLDSLSSNGWFLWRYAGEGGKKPRAPYRLSITTAMFPSSGSLTAAARGDYDAYWRKMAAEFVRYGYGDAILRPGHEMNCCYPWNATSNAAGYVAAFRHFVEVTRSVAGAHFLYDWCPMAGAADPTSMYPGDAYVDIVGLDVYPDWYGVTDENARWDRLMNETAGLAWQRAFAAAHGKPMSYPEWNVNVRTSSKGHGTGDDPAFIDRFHDWIASNDVLYAASYNDDNGGLLSALRDGRFPRSLDEYRRRFGG